MITKQQWNNLCELIHELMPFYDFHLLGERVLFANGGDRASLVTERITFGGAKVVAHYSHENSFCDNKLSLSEVEDRIQVKTKPERIVDCSLRKWKCDIAATKHD